jgi:hypothetical protein
MIEIKAIFSISYLVQHAAGNPGGTKKAIYARSALNHRFKFKKKLSMWENVASGP